MLYGIRRTPFVNRLFHLYWRFARGMTMGARGMVLDAENRVFLIKHTYSDGWQMPGGGVEPKETVRASLERELAEEGNIELTGEPALLGVYFNNYASERDHVVIYVVRDFRQTKPRAPDYEIAETGFFSIDALPEIVEAVRASYALPGIFDPVKIAGRWLMDGALVNPVPVTAARALGADVVLHSVTKYLGGHSDLIGGAIVTSDEALVERLTFLQNAAGWMRGGSGDGGINTSRIAHVNTICIAQSSGGMKSG